MVIKHWQINISIKDDGETIMTASHGEDMGYAYYVRAGASFPGIVISEKDYNEFESWYRRVVLGMKNPVVGEQHGS